MFEPTSTPAPTSMFGRSTGQPPCSALSNRRLLSLNLGQCPEGSLEIKRSTAIRPGPAAVAGNMTVKERSNEQWTSTRTSLMATCRLSRRSTPGSSARERVRACEPASATEKLMRPLSPIKQAPGLVRPVPSLGQQVGTSQSRLSRVKLVAPLQPVERLANTELSAAPSETISVPAIAK